MQPFLTRAHINPAVTDITPGISLFTAIKNRHEMLKESLISWIQHDSILEIIIVDWSSDESVRPLVEKLQNGKITLVTVPDQKTWILSSAFNLAARFTSHDKILKTDADVIISPSFFEVHRLKPGSFFTGNWKIARNPGEKHLHGTFFAYRDDFFAVNGYNEYIKSYGWDDIDLYQRLDGLQLQHLDIDLNTLHHRDHEMRTSAQGHMNFLENDSDHERSLLNSCINKFLSESTPRWGPENLMMQFEIANVDEHCLVANQCHADVNVVPEILLHECEKQGILLRFTELGAGLSADLLRALTREDLIALLNLYFARAKSSKQADNYNLIKKISNKYIFDITGRDRKIDELNIKIQNQSVQLASVYGSYSWKVGHSIFSLLDKIVSPLMEIQKNLKDSVENNISSFGRIIRRNILHRKVDLNDQVAAYYGKHRSGWSYAVHSIADLHDPEGVLFDTFIERTFGWNTGNIHPHKKPWIGVVHVPPHVPEWFSHKLSNNSIFSSSVWLESYSYCRGLYTLSRYHQVNLQSKLSIPVNHLIHPTEEPEMKWCWDSFYENENKKVIQVGFWLRKLYSIYLLDAPKYQKIFLRKEGVNIDYLLRMEREHCERKHDITKNRLASVREINFLSNEEYDWLLTRNIVFLELYDASANNTIIECIMRNTPVLVNPIKAVIEYLGEDYPFYFSSLDEASDKIADYNLIKQTHLFLKNHPIKRKLTGKYFRQSLIDSEIYSKL